MSTLYSSHAAREHELIRVMGCQGSESTYPTPEHVQQCGAVQFRCGAIRTGGRKGAVSAPDATRVDVRGPLLVAQQPQYPSTQPRNIPQQSDRTTLQLPKSVRRHTSKMREPIPPKLVHSPFNFRELGGHFPLPDCCRPHRPAGDALDVALTESQHFRGYTDDVWWPKREFAPPFSQTDTLEGERHRGCRLLAFAP